MAFTTTKRLRFAILSALLLPMLSPGLEATEYHVAPTGSDRASGTSAAPFETISRGRRDLESRGYLCDSRGRVPGNRPPGVLRNSGPADPSGGRCRVKTWVVSGTDLVAGALDAS